MSAPAPCPNCGSLLLSPDGICHACATVGELVSAPEDLPRFNGFRVLRPLGAGAMGAVYLAQDETLGRKVAIKILGPDLLRDESANKRFRREARVMASVEHPNVVRLYSLGHEPSGDFLVMEFIPGSTLADQIRSRGAIDWAEALAWVQQAAEGLQAAWEHQIVHRDIKPSNLLLDERGRLRVSDFGLSRSASASMTESLSATTSGTLVGTPLYMSPEQIRGEELDLRSDIYSLGLVFFTLLTAENPFDGDSAMTVLLKNLKEPLPDLRQRRPELPEIVVRVVEWMTAKAKEHRPESYAALLTALAEAQAGHSRLGEAWGTATARISQDDPAVSRQMIRARLRLAVAVVVVAALAAVVGWLSIRDSGPSMKVAIEAPFPSMTLAVAPFWGPDEASERDGRVIATLAERELKARLDPATTQVLGIEETKVPVRSHGAARELALRLGAVAIVWGEVLALGNEAEISPRVTLVEPATRDGRFVESSFQAEHPARDMAQAGLARDVREYQPAPLSVSALGTSQLTLRKASAKEIGDTALLAAALYLLNQRSDAQGALKLLSGLGENLEVLRLRAEATALAGNVAAALEIGRRGLALAPEDASLLGLVGDLLVRQDQRREAFDHYQRSGASTDTPWTLEGAAFRDLLYLPETFRTAGSQDAAGFEEVVRKRNLYVVAEDPTSRTVVDRIRLPGWPAGFRVDGESLVIRVQMLLGGSGYFFEDYQIDPSGRLDRFAPLSAPNVIPRLPKFPPVEEIAWNFLPTTESCTGRIGLRPEKDRRPWASEDLGEVRTRLAAEWARDPTQPWTAFLGAIAARADNELELMSALRQKLRSEAFEPIPYYDWARMADAAECFGDPGLADELLARALETRLRMRVPVWSSFELNQLVNAPLRSVSGAWGRTLPHERRFHRLVQSRALTGSVIEQDPLLMRSWGRELRSLGDLERAATAQGFAEAAAREPLQVDLLAGRVDRWLGISAGLGGASLLLLLGFLRERTGCATAPTLSPESSSEQVKKGSRNFLAVGAKGLIGVGTLWLVLAPESYLLTGRQRVALLTGIWLVVLAVHARRFKARQTVLQSLPKRTALSVCFGLFAAALATLVTLESSAFALQHVREAPIGLADAMDHPAVIAYIENAFGELESRRGLRFAGGVGMHLAERRKEASEAYRRLADDPRAAENLRDLEKGLGPKHFPNSRDYLPARRSVGEWSRSPFGAIESIQIGTGEESDDARAFLLATIGALFPSLLLITTIAAAASGWRADSGSNRAEAVGRRARLEMWISAACPGWADLELGRPFRAALILIGISAFISVASLTVLAGEYALALQGPVASSEFFLKDSWVLPQILADPEQRSSFVFWNTPGHAYFLLAVAGAFVVAAAFQVLASLQLLRRGGLAR